MYFALPSRQLLECPLVDEVDDCLGSRELVVDVAHPALDLVGVAENLLLIGEITLLL